MLCSVPSEFERFRTMNIGKGIKGYSFISFSFQYKSTFFKGLHRKEENRKENYKKSIEKEIVSNCCVHGVQEYK